MKKLFYLFLSFTLFISGIHAQDCNDVTASVTVTPSTCQSNGSITITFGGASADKLVGKRYSIKSTTGTTSYGPVSTNVFDGLPPGNYNLEAAGFCNTIEGEAIVRTVNNVTVGGSYIEPRLTFVAQSISANTAATLTSRKSYVNCSTGLIVLQLENGNQSTMPSFTITSAPAGVTVPQTVSATKATSGSVATGWRYLLDGTWPAGRYTVYANDGCYTSVASFIIDELTTLPPGSVSSSYFYPYNDGTDCSKFYYQPYYSYSSTTYPDWYRYYVDGLYEYGIAPVGEMPKEENWFRVRYFSGSSSSYRDLFDLSPGSIPNYRTANSLTVYTRVKSCPSVIASANTYIQYQTSMTSNTNTCTGVRTYSFTYSKSSYPYYHLYCYPLTITVTDRSTGDPISSNSNYLYTDANFSWSCNPGESQYLNITDASGYKILTNYAMSGDISTLPTISLNAVSGWPEYNNCDDYKRTYSISGCVDQSIYPYYLTITDGSGNVFKSETVTSTSSGTVTNLQYGTTYTFTVVFPNLNNHSSSATSFLNRADNIPNAFTLTKYSPSPCYDNTGQLTLSSISRVRSFKAGTTITVTGPAGYIGQSYTYPSNIDGYNYYFAETYLPPGEYTATIVSCGETFTASTTIARGYTGDRLSYTTEQDCMGLKLFPSGSISNNGTPLSTIYFRMTQVPSGSGAGTKVIPSTSNDSFLLTTAGTYIFGMMTSNSISGCTIKLDTIVYNPLPLALDKDKTSAYSCPGGENGYLTLQATNGTLPYTYTVYDSTYTVRLTEPMTSYEALELGSFGIAKNKYIVYIQDACGNAYPQPVRLVSLDEEPLAYGQTMVCYNTPIQIYGFTVTNATYSWTGPNGFTSSVKNPVIPNAKPINAGRYYVDIHSLTCNITVRDSIDITVYDPVIPVELNGITQEVTLCPYEALVIGQAATGGSGGITYQWQQSTVGTTWSNISGQTSPIFKGTATTYMFTSTTASPSYRYLRLAVTDAYCGTFYLTYHTNVKGCMYLVNPDLKSPASTEK